MYKVGTGEGNTIAGKVYLFLGTEKESDIAWTHCRGKLYLRRANDDPGVISIVDTITFKTEGLLKLRCDEAFSDPQTLKYNRFYPLLSDGKSLYIISVYLKTLTKIVKTSRKLEYEKVKRGLEEQRKKEDEVLKKLESEKSKKEEEGGEKSEGIKKELLKKKKEKRKIEDSAIMKRIDDTVRVCEFGAYEFDVSAQLEEDKQCDSENVELVEELYQSFTGYFSKKECHYALKLNKNHIQVHTRIYIYIYIIT